MKRLPILTTLCLTTLCFALSLNAASSDGPNELRFCLRADPKTFDPQLVEDDNSEAVRYLTAGVLIRFDRKSQHLTPELATSWKVDLQGKRITFQLRHGVTFSDGTPFAADDVAFTMKRLMDPQTHSPTGDTFRSSEILPKIAVLTPDSVSITFGAPVAGLERLFDAVGVISARSARKTAAVLGAYRVAGYKPGVEVLLERNPHYWKVDASGARLPYTDRIHLDIQQNRDIELVRFRRGEIDLINSLDADTYDQLSKVAPRSVFDAGASLEAEMMWFNQAPSSPLPAFKQRWFQSSGFRRAVSEAINRQDICRIVYKGHATPAVGPISPANQFWFNHTLKPHAYDTGSAMRRLEAEGFRLRNGQLFDREGHTVEFSLITNAGNRPRERIAAMVQQDLRTVGIRLNVVALDFPSLIERITRTFDYEVCLLGLTNLDLDPSAQMNVWLSSAANHQWNPSQKQPATRWEAEIDELMRKQATDTRDNERKRLFDRVQQIVWEEAPFIYVVSKNALMAISPDVQNSSPAILQPQAYWNIETLRKAKLTARSR